MPTGEPGPPPSGVEHYQLQYNDNFPTEVSVNLNAIEVKDENDVVVAFDIAGIGRVPKAKAEEFANFLLTRSGGTYTY